MLIIGRLEFKCDSFRVRGAYSNTIARLFSLPIVTENSDPVVIDIVTKGTDFKPYTGSKRVYWNRKFIGFFAVGNVAQEWDGDKYRTRFDLRQCETSNIPDDDIPLYKWRHDLRALYEKLPQTDGAKLEAGRVVDPFANSWKQPGSVTTTVTDNVNITPAVLSIREGGTGASEANLALLNLGGIPSSSKGVPFGIAPLGADGKVPASFLTGGGGGGGIPISEKGAALGVAPLDAASKVPSINLPDYPTLASLNAVSNSTFSSAIANLIPISAIGVASGVAPLDTNSRVPAINLPAYPTLSSLGGIASSLIGAASGVAPLDTNSRVPAINLPAYPTLSSLGGIASSLIGAASGVAPLDTNSRVPAINLPAYPTLSSLGGIASSQIGAASGVAPLDTNSRVPAINLPAYPTLSSLGGIASSLIGAANGVAPLDSNSKLLALYLPSNVAYLNVAQSFTLSQTFTAGIVVRGGNPPTLTTGIYNSVDANGLPRVWLVNSAASANNRVKSITIANNGNIQIRHHNDDLTDGNVLEHTASGNVLTNGTLRPGGGTSNFSGASFLPGAIYFRSDINMLVYSDGTSWRRMDTNAAV